MAGKLAKLAASMAGPSDELVIWPENVESVNFFIDYCRTQWRVGMGGPTGLDYTAVLATLRDLGLPRDRRKEVFEDVRTLELGALAALSAK